MSSTSDIWNPPQGWLSESIDANLPTGGTMQPPRQKTGPLPVLKHPELGAPEPRRHKPTTLVLMPTSRPPRPNMARMGEQFGLIATLVMALLLSCALGG